VSLHVETAGTGADVVLLHGWGTSGRILAPLARELARTRRVHVVDLPGYGRSSACVPYTLDEITEILARSLPRRCQVCGWSLGGLAALAWARRAPQQVTALGLIATTPCFVRRAEWPHAVAAETLDEFAESLGTDAAATLRRFYALQALGDARAARVAGQLRETLRREPRADPAVLAAGLAILRETDLRGELAQIPRPALVIQGGRDRLVPPAAAKHLSQTLSGARLAVMPEAAHAPHLSSVREVSALLGDFFDGR
jgi:pimeloyl-[acyl-carrier protein] methyl ester esterase